MPAGASRVGHTDRRARTNYRVRPSRGGLGRSGFGGVRVGLTQIYMDDLPGG